MVKERESDWTMTGDELGQGWAYRYRRRFEDVNKLAGFIERAHGLNHTRRVVLQTTGFQRTIVVGQDVEAELLAFASASHVRGLTITGQKGAPVRDVWRVTFAHNVMEGGRPLVVAAALGSAVRDALIDSTVATRSKRPQRTLPPLTGQEAEQHRLKRDLQRRATGAGAVAGFGTTVLTLGGRALIG